MIVNRKRIAITRVRWIIKSLPITARAEPMPMPKIPIRVPLNKMETKTRIETRASHSTFVFLLSQPLMNQIVHETAKSTAKFVELSDGPSIRVSVEIILSTKAQMIMKDIWTVNSFCTRAASHRTKDAPKKKASPVTFTKKKIIIIW